jgi:hypothetical protein
MPAPANGRARKSLEGQLDRLDSILDGLADALNESVADAVKETVGLAVKQAVEAVVAELLTNPLVVKKVAEAHGLDAAQPVSPAPARTWRDRLAAGWRAVKEIAAAVFAQIRRAVVSVRGSAVAATAVVAAAVAERVRSVRTVLGLVTAVARLTRRRLWIAAAIGLVLGVGCYLGGPAVGGWVSGLAGSVLAYIAGLVRPVWPFVRMAIRGTVLLPRPI